jgi:peptide-methionine (S)-S-oxide reductase
MRHEVAILAGGCYWGVQELMRRQPGVISTRVGYSGGATPNPTDDDPGDHAEAVEVVYDTDTVTYRDLLEFFFQIHDPTTVDRQGDEVGRYVRSAIFYTSDEQRLTAVDTLADVDASGLWPGRVVTEVAAAGPFWEAAEEDQNYLQKHPGGETCHFARPGWKLARRPAQRT